MTLIGEKVYTYLEKLNTQDHHKQRRSFVLDKWLIFNWRFYDSALVLYIYSIRIKDSFYIMLSKSYIYKNIPVFNKN